MNDTQHTTDAEYEEMHAPENQEQSMEPAATDPRHPQFGLILALLIVTLILILGSLYLWQLVAFSPDPEPAPVPERVVPDMPNEPEVPNAEAEIQQQQTFSNSTSIEAIEAELESTQLDELDVELEAIDAELEAALGNLL